MKEFHFQVHGSKNEGKYINYIVIHNIVIKCCHKENQLR